MPILTRIAAAACAPLLALSATSALAQPAAPLKNDVVTRVDAMYPWLDTIYKDLHAHPEIAFQEVRTAGKLAAEMRKLGFTVTEKVGKTGIVAVLKNGAGPTVLVRTDMDGLPMEEKTGLPYASRARATSEGRDSFVTHSCGHDIHMTSWLATARTLVELKGQWKGTLVFIGQPAEEIVSGAKAMLDDGLFKRFPKPDYAFALHSWPLAYGTIGYNDGPVSSNSDSLEITFKGRGGHGSAPDKTVDPIAIAARFVVDVQTVVSREKDPKEFGVVTIGSIQGGTVGNIIPDSVQVRGTIRSYSPAGTGQAARGRAPRGGRIGRDGRRTEARDADRRRWPGDRQQHGAGQQDRGGVQGSVRRRQGPSHAGHDGQRRLFAVCERRRAVDVLLYRRV